MSEKEKNYAVLLDYALTIGYDPEKTVLPVGMWCAEHSMHRLRGNDLLRKLYFNWYNMGWW